MGTLQGSEWRVFKTTEEIIAGYSDADLAHCYFSDKVDWSVEFKALLRDELMKRGWL